MARNRRFAHSIVIETRGSKLSGRQLWASAFLISFLPSDQFPLILFMVASGKQFGDYPRSLHAGESLVQSLVLDAEPPVVKAQKM
jgi:hypothetical protein